MRGLRHIILIAAVMLIAPAPASAYRFAQGCIVGFNDAFALMEVYANARATFASRTMLSNSGYPDTALCSPGSTKCWIYRERCGVRDFVNVEEWPIGAYGHFHLSFETAVLNDPNQTCFVDPGDGYGTGMGWQSGTRCVAPDWVTEPRVANTHDQNQTIRIWVESGISHQPRAFSLIGLTIKGSIPARVSFRKRDGSWWYWPSLAAIQFWNLSTYTQDITDVHVRAAEGAGGSVSFDDFYVRTDTAP